MCICVRVPCWNNDCIQILPVKLIQVTIKPMRNQQLYAYFTSEQIDKRWRKPNDSRRYKTKGKALVLRVSSVVINWKGGATWRTKGLFHLRFHANSPSLREIRKELKQGMSLEAELMQRPSKSPVYWFVFHEFLRLPYSNPYHQPRVGNPHSELDPPHQSLILKPSSTLSNEQS